MAYQTYPSTARMYDDGTTKVFIIKDNVHYKVLCDLNGVCAKEFFKYIVFSAPDATATNKTTGEVFSNPWCTMRKFTEKEYEFAPEQQEQA